MIYFIATACLFNNNPERDSQYIKGINILKNVIELHNITDYKIIIVENNGNRNTFLEDLGCIVYYTNNNSLSTINKGYKELQDVLDCITYFDIKDDDFIVKITGRYFLDNDSEFMSVLKNINTIKYDCILKYGWYGGPVDYKTKDCITALIGMRCYYVKQIEKPAEQECVEWKWATATYLMDDANIYKVNKLGIKVAPFGGSNYSSL
jgi:hypothetical protein